MGLFAFNRARREAAARDQQDADTQDADTQDADTQPPAPRRRRKDPADDAQQRSQDADSAGG